MELLKRREAFNVSNPPPLRFGEKLEGKKRQGTKFQGLKGVKKCEGAHVRREVTACELARRFEGGGRQGDF